MDFAKLKQFNLSPGGNQFSDQKESLLTFTPLKTPVDKKGRIVRDI